MAKKHEKMEVAPEMESVQIDDEVKAKIKAAMAKDAEKAPKRKVPAEPSLAQRLAYNLDMDKTKVRRLQRKFKEEADHRAEENPGMQPFEIWVGIFEDYAEGKLTTHRAKVAGSKNKSRMIRAARCLHLDEGFSKEEIIAFIEEADLETKGVFGKKKEAEPVEGFDGVAEEAKEAEEAEEA